MRKSLLRAQFFIVIGFTVVGVLYIDRRITKPRSRCSCEDKVYEKPNLDLDTHNAVRLLSTSQAQVKDADGTTLKQEVKPKSDSPKESNANKKVFPNVKQDQANTKPADEWSKIWPRVHLKNCSIREFMNKGINSPNVTINLPYTETGIMSFPGSGNTWTRFLIEQATGLWTGSVYRDGSLYKGGFIGEMEDPEFNSTVAVKDHGQAGRVHERVILVIRDPHRALLSEFNRRLTGGSHIKGANASVLESEAWEKYLRTWAVKKWSRSNIGYIKMYMNKSKPLGKDENPFTKEPGHWKRLLLVSYERLKQDASAEMDRVVKFLGLPVFRRHCLEENAKGNFRRPPKSAEKIACLYRKPEIQKIMKETKDFIFKEGRTIGTGNLLSEIKETYAIQNNNICVEDMDKPDKVR